MTERENEDDPDRVLPAGVLPAGLPAGVLPAGLPAGVLPAGVLVARLGAGANCSSAGSAIDILFYTSVLAGAVAVALSAAFPPRSVATEARSGDGDGKDPPSGDDPTRELR